MPGCCAVGCKNRSEKGFRMFRLPTDVNRRKIWSAQIRRESWTPSTSSRLCEVHFDSTQFESKRLDGRKLLKPFAIPELFPHRPLKPARKPPAIRNIAPKVGSKKKSSNKKPRLETDPLEHTNRVTETASPPREESHPANEDSVHSSSEVDIKPDVDTLFGNETERMAGLEADPTRGANRRTETASPPPEEACPANEDSVDSSSEVDIKPDVNTLNVNETEQMRADRERIMKHPYECCRLCLERSGDLTDIFQGTELGLVIRQAIKDFLHFEVVRNGESPWQVCYTCMQKLSEFQEFKDRCVETKILWDDCSKYIDESTSTNNHRSNATQTTENIGLQPEVHSKPDVMTGGTVNLLQHARKDGERTGNEMITTGDRDLSVSKDNSMIDEGGCINNRNGKGKDRGTISHLESIPSVMRTPHNSHRAEIHLDGGGCESRLNPMPNQRTPVHQNTEPNSTWQEDKENSTAIQVKGMYELDDSKGSDGEPLVLILRVDGAVELCALSEIPLNMRAGIQKYSKMAEHLTKKRPREKGD